MSKPLKYFTAGAGLIVLSLLFIRFIDADFAFEIPVNNHPVSLLLALLLFPGAVWILLVGLIKKYETDLKGAVLLSLAFGVLARALFFGSTPIYEDDWTRYLWDGAVSAQGISPYVYSPDDVLGLPNGHQDQDLLKLNQLSDTNDSYVNGINNPHLTTIYPPVAQLYFYAAYRVSPFNMNALRLIYLLSEVVTFALIIKLLRVYGRAPVWVSLYALNPIVAFSAFNGLHMDILLLPFLLGSLLYVQRQPLFAALCLSLAIALKLWPLLLAPVIFRCYRKNGLNYIGLGVLIAGLSFLLCWPMLVQISTDSGLQAYSTAWQRSSFIFPMLASFLGLFIENGDAGARLFVGAAVSALALHMSVVLKADTNKLPQALMCLIVVFFLLSPTGFPWYVIWFAFLLPFVPVYGAASLSVLVSLYYARFFFGETARYAVYTQILVPIQFGVPLIILAFEGLRLSRSRKVSSC